jgi:hypothetical protein
MHALNLITDKAWQAARKTKMVTHPKTTLSSCALSPYPYFCTYVSEWLMEQQRFAVTEALRSGMTINSIIIACKADATRPATFYPREFTERASRSSSRGRSTTTRARATVRSV